MAMGTRISGLLLGMGGRRTLEPGSLGKCYGPAATPRGAWPRTESAMGGSRAEKQIWVTSLEPWIQLVLTLDPTLQFYTFMSRSFPFAL